MLCNEYSNKQSKVNQHLYFFMFLGDSVFSYSKLIVLLENKSDPESLVLQFLIAPERLSGLNWTGRGLSRAGSAPDVPLQLRERS